MEGESDDFEFGVLKRDIYCILHVDSYFTNVEAAIARHMVT